MRVVLLLVLGAGFALRLVSALYLTPHVDEAASVLAIQVVADQVVPVLPSGNVYFQGYTLSLLLSPLAWLGFADLNDLLAMRLVSVVAGTATIYFAYRLAFHVTRRQLAAVVTAALVALDPLSVQWSGHVRMYALLQLIAFCLAWVWIDIVSEGTSRRRLIAGVSLGWLAVFTHSGASLLVGSILLVVIAVKRRSVLRDIRLRVAVIALGGAPIALLVLNQLLRPGAMQQGTATGDNEGVTFVGDSLVRPFARFEDGRISSQLAALQSDGVQLWFLSVMPVAVASLAGVALLLSGVFVEAKVRATIWYVCGTFWPTALAFALFTDSLAGRYLLHVYTVGYVLVPILFVEMVRAMPDARGPALRRGATAVAIGFVILMTASSLSRTDWRLRHPVMNSDYHAAMAYVVEHHRPGQPVVVALPPVAYLALGEEHSDDIYFLAGHEGSSRAQDYSRLDEDGRRIDYWVGVDTIVTADGLRDLLLRHPDAFVVVDPYRMSVSWAYAGPIAEVIRELTTPVYEGPGGVVVLTPAATEIGPVPQGD